MKPEVLSSLAKEYSTPFYAFFPDDFTANYQELTEEYEAVYRPFSIAYSFKTNYMPAAVCRVLELGGYAEVVSDHEYAIARKVGFSPERILVNGPGKWHGMEEMISDGAILMLDNSFELDRAMRIAGEKQKTVKIGFRLNFEIGTNKQSRFGFDADNPETESEIRRAREFPLFQIIGLHFHLGGSRSLEAWKTRAEKMTAYADRFLREEERQIIDLGSGMFGHLHPDFAVQFHQQIPGFREYASAVAGVFREKYGSLPAEKRPKLIVEPGATIIANTMVYATGVIATKTVRGRNIAMVDGSVHQLGELGKKKQLPVHVVHGQGVGKALSSADISGYTCLEDDILFRGLPEPVKVGDVLVFENAGAYTNVMKPPFIRGGCKILSCTEKGETTLVKRDETADDLLSTYEV